MKSDQPKVSISASNQLYVIDCGEGITCWGFQNAFDETYQLAERLGATPPAETLFGTLELYERHKELIKAAGELKKSFGTWFHRFTPIKVRRALEWARDTGAIVRIWTGDINTGEADLEENDTIGVVSRSTGLLKVPLLVKGFARGGPAISDNRIVRIRNESRMEDLYKHKKFHLPHLRIVEGQKGTDEEGNIDVFAKGQVHSCHDTYEEACALIAFFHGMAPHPDPLIDHETN